MNEDEIYNAQKGLLELQICLEDLIKKQATNCNEDSVIICDRGTLDGKAYIDNDNWLEIIRESGYPESDLRDRYL